MLIEPDDKDWTWVLERRCPECRFDAATFPPDGVAPRLRANASAWQHMLTAAPVELRRRSRDDRWSPLEYACHVRDVFSLFADRLDLMLEHDDPLFPNWDQDATALEEDYGAQDPVLVSTELAAAAAGLADAFERVRGDQWSRRGRRSDGAAFTVDSFSRYLVHDPVHHLYDVTGERAPGRAPGP